MNTMIQKSSQFFSLVKTHQKNIGIALIGISVLAGGMYGFQQYHLYQTEQAYAKLLTIEKYLMTEIGKKQKISDFEAIQFLTADEKWNVIEAESSKAKNAFSGTKLKGVFTAYHGRALLEQGRKEAAIDDFIEASNSIADPAMAAQFALKAAALQLDSENETIRQNGLEKIKALVNKKHLPVHIFALHTLGEYAWINKKYDEAQNYWSQLLISVQSDKQLENLELIKEVKTRLKTIKAS
jgi:tetratricopeptide (TPR) repeat protein